MSKPPDLLERIGGLVRSGRYRLRLHAVRHMIEEGFDEGNIIEVLTGRGCKLLEQYPDQHRCLVLGFYAVEERTRNPMHVVCDHSHREILDIVTAYVPQPPWWVTPSRRGKRR